MRVAIHSVDGRNFPNLALMKISMWHKLRGDSVEWFIPLIKYDRVYASKVFTFTPDDPYLPPETIKGGTGYNVTGKLPPEVEAMKPDYTIYPEFDSAYGFLTRGCPNRCPWCVVPRKEGAICQVADIEDICETNTGFRRKAILMDNNFLAAPLDFIKAQADKMKRLSIRVDFTQATDARLYDEDRARIMAGLLYISVVRLSCDTDTMINHCINAIKSIRHFGCKRDILVYVLAKNDGIESALYRIYKLMEQDRRVVPFVMPYRSLTDNSIKPSSELRRLARWCNRAWIRKSCRFEDYK